MIITQHNEAYNVTLEAGETATVTVNGVTVNWTVQAGKTAQFSVQFNEEIIKETPT